MNKLALRIVVNTAIGVALIYAWTRFVNIEEVWQKLITANPFIVFGVVFCLAFSAFLRAARFKVLLPDKNVSLTQITLFTYLGQLLSFVIPVRIGEFAKGIYISTQTNKPIAQSILWVFVDRLVDFWVVISLIGILLFIVPTQVPANVNYIVGGLAIIFSLGIAITIYYPLFIKKVASICLTLVFIKRLRTLLTKFVSFVIDSFSILNVKPSRQLVLILLTTLSWVVESIPWFLIILGLGGTISLPVGIVLGTMLMALSFILPSAPGYLGSLQAAGLLVFSLWLGYDAVLISAATIFMHLSIIIYVLFAGIGSLYFLKIDLGELFKKFNLKQ